MQREKFYSSTKGCDTLVPGESIPSPFQHFCYISGELHCDGVSLLEIAKEIGTPYYVYSKAAMLEKFREFSNAFSEFDHLLCYSVKANSNVSVIRLFVQAGAGLDVNSGGELYRALLAGADPQRIVFTGVGKTDEEIQYALRQRVLFLKVESIEELDVINEIARSLGVDAPVALRVNPSVDAGTHPYISTGLAENKFGIPWEQVEAAYEHAISLPHLRVTGVDMHIGSQITSVDPFVDAVSKLVELVGKLRAKNITLSHLDIGGGLGIPYAETPTPGAADLARALRPLLQSVNLTVVLEPGRYLTGNAGALVTKTLYRKHTGLKQFLIVDAGMNDLLRPTLYQAYHHIMPVSLHERETETVDVVGPVCESADYFAKERQLPRCERGELLAIMSAGAYGFVMSSNYNSRPRLPELLVDGDHYTMIRKRETYEDIVRQER